MPSKRGVTCSFVVIPQLNRGITPELTGEQSMLKIRIKLIASPFE